MARTRENPSDESVGAATDGDMSVMQQLVGECQAMASFALASGMRIPASVLENVTVAANQMSSPDGIPEQLMRAHIKRLVQAHDQLVHIVSPASPRTLTLFARERTSALGPVRLVRQMMVLSVVLLIVFLATALSPRVTNSSGDIFNSSGETLAVNELFLLSAAGIGAAFAALFTANKYIAEITYDEKYESSYWVRFVLGLLAGIVLASLIPIKASGNGAGLSKPFLSLLGGFSASVVFRILARVVGSLESLVQGDRSDTESATRRTTLAEAATQRVQDQMRVSASLVKLREQLGAGVTPELLTASVNRMLDDFMPAEASFDEPDPAPVVDHQKAEARAPASGDEEAAAEAEPLVPTAPAPE